MKNLTVRINEIENVELINGGYYGATGTIKYSIINKKGEELFNGEREVNLMPFTDDSIYDFYYDGMENDIDYIDDDKFEEYYEMTKEEAQRYIDSDVDDEEFDKLDERFWKYVYSRLDDYYNMILEQGEDFELITEETEEEIIDDYNYYAEMA